MEHRIRYPDFIGVWVIACCVIAAAGLVTVVIRIPLISEATALLAALFGLVMLLARPILRKQLDWHRSMAGCVIIACAILNGIVGVDHWRAEVQPPVTRRVLGHWEADGELFIRTDQGIYEGFDRSTWPPQDGADICLTIRDPRLGPSSVERVTQGACDE